MSGSAVGADLPGDLVLAAQLIAYGRHLRDSDRVPMPPGQRVAYAKVWARENWRAFVPEASAWFASARYGELSKGAD